VTGAPPEFTAGILQVSSTLQLHTVANVQQLWFPPVWAATGLSLTGYLSNLYKKLQGEDVQGPFHVLCDMNKKLTEQQKIFIAIRALAEHWGTLAKCRKLDCARRIEELRLKKNLGVNNFSNYAAEAGWRRMGDSQVNRLWTKVLNAARRAERFAEEMKRKRKEDLSRFERANRANPFLFSIMKRLSPD
jgi:hypothetical protein